MGGKYIMERKEKIARIRESMLKNQYPMEFNQYRCHRENCYAYILGSDFEDDMSDGDYIYNLGCMSQVNYPPKTIPEAEEAFYSDMEVLGVDCRRCELDAKVAPGEWKVVLFYEGFFSDSYDFHFVKEDKGGGWSHKQGVHGGVWRFGRDPRSMTDLDFVDCYILKMIK